MDKKPKILCVDDDKQILSMYEFLLDSSKYDVVMLGSGEEALEWLKNNLPDLILLDVMMIKMTGIETLEKIRGNERTRLMPVVIVSSMQETNDRVRAMEAGCDDFLPKPFDKTELLVRVRSLLRISYFRSQLNEKEKFETVLYNMGDGVIVCSPDFKIVEINMSAKRLLNITDFAEMDFIGQIFSQFNVSTTKDDLVKNEKSAFTAERKGDSKPLILEFGVDFIKAPDNKLLNIIFVARDVTKKMIEETMSQNFLSLVSHKLRTPLTVVSGMFGLLADGIKAKAGEDQVKMISGISQNISKLNVLFDKLLTFIEFGEKQEGEEAILIDLPEYIGGYFEKAQNNYSNKKINFKKEFQTGIPKVKIIERKLELIFYNLVDNAVKFNDKAAIEITAAVSQEAGFLKVRFSDNGVGIPSEDFEKVFGKFYQVEKFFTGQVEGVGLGLALIKKIVEREGGKISVESKLGEGASFVILLPAAK
ncbi:MAG: Sensor protein [Candidatus Saganbacteria bacterium]|uniref:histidine kinase n=1 Tax=Candidatus Saganbacteria bacterium TaxID=2575572 RepID=A0A833L1L7_UNCSA|nr:MAG: Sensor protein [Candidatus Saganbacteria bacterium]